MVGSHELVIHPFINGETLTAPDALCHCHLSAACFYSRNADLLRIIEANLVRCFDALLVDARPTPQTTCQRRRFLARRPLLRAELRGR